jgi:hypothetical protein
MRFLGGLVVGLVLAVPVRAEIMVGDTAEWLAHTSALIARATPVKVENVKGPGEVWFTRTRFRLDDVIKGPASDGDSVTVYDWSYETADAALLAKACKAKQQLLVFARAAENLFKEINGKYVLTRTRGVKSVYAPGEPVENLYTADFGVLTAFAELERDARAQVRQEISHRRVYPRGRVLEARLEAPMGSEAHRKLCAGSTCYVRVPFYEKEAPKDETAAGTDGP